MVRFALHARVVPDDRLGIPIEHHDNMDPARTFHQDLRHVHARPLVELRGPGFFPCRCPLSFQLQIGPDDDHHGLGFGIPFPPVLGGSPWL
jgi:hypothetical protein